MREFEKRAREIWDLLYKAYGSGTGYLFGIEPGHKTAVLHIIEFTLEQNERIEKEKRE